MSDHFGRKSQGECKAQSLMIVAHTGDAVLAIVLAHLPHWRSLRHGPHATGLKISAGRGSASTVSKGVLPAETCLQQ